MKSAAYESTASYRKTEDYATEPGKFRKGSGVI